LRPKDDGAGLYVVHFQFFIYAIVGEAVHAVAEFHRDKPFRGAVVIGLIPIWCTIYALALRLFRRRAAKLKPAELTEFLAQVVLRGGALALAAMIYCSFETIVCWMCGDGLQDKQCSDSVSAAKWLSVYSAITRAVSIASKTVPKGEHGKNLTLSDLAILRMSWSKKLQGILRLITTLLSMFLFGFLGSGDPYESGEIYSIGAIGSIASGLAGIIEILTVLRSSRMAKKRKKTEKALGPGRLKQSSAEAGLGWSTRLGGIDDQFAFGGLQGDGGVPKSIL